MKDRIPEKNAIIFFNPEYEDAARAFVRENLQYRTQYQHFYMVPVPAKKKGNPKLEDLMEMLTKRGITKTNTDSYLIEKKAATKWGEAEENNYGETVLKCARNFKKHFVIVTYDYFQGEKKFSSLSRYREHMRYSSSQGFPKDTVTQVGLLEGILKGKTKVIAASFFSKQLSYQEPPYEYILLRGMKSRFRLSQALNEERRKDYEFAIQQEVSFREQKVEPILSNAEQNYPDPKSVAKKLGNLFREYAFGSLDNIKRPHRWLAANLMRKLYAHPKWELEECLHVIKSRIDNLSEPLNPRGTLQGLLLAILNMMHDQSIFHVGVQLEDVWQEKYAELTKVQETMKGDGKACVAIIAQELKKLEAEGRPRTLLLKAAESTLNMVQQPSETSYQKQYKLAYEIGKSTQNKILAGSLLCLLGVCLAISIGLAVYFSGGAALLLGAPLVVYGVMLSAALINAGAAVIAGTAAASLPLLGGALCFFKKEPKPLIQTNMEQLADLQLPFANNHLLLS